MEITIADNGIGFDNAYAHIVFQPFERLHTKEYDGSGIGLAICQKIVKTHGGNIHFNSKPGDGLLFVFSKNPQEPLLTVDCRKISFYR